LISGKSSANSISTLCAASRRALPLTAALTMSLGSAHSRRGITPPAMTRVALRSFYKALELLDFVGYSGGPKSPMWREVR
jgi:hypothetical protein